MGYHSPALGAKGLLEKTVETARAYLAPEHPADGSLRRQAIWQRLSRPSCAGEFSAAWMGDDGRVRADRGFWAVFGCGEVRGRLILRSGLDLDEAAALAFLDMLSASLRDVPGASLVCGVARDPATLSDGESMRLCSCLTRFIRSIAPGIEAWADLPPREAGYIRAALPRVYAWPEAAGRGLCYLAQAVLRRGEGAGLLGRRTAVLGEGALARAATEQAARMGASVVDAGDADVVFLCGTGNSVQAQAFHGRTPEAVFEGVPLACGPEEVRRYREAGVLFVPSAAAGAGGRLWQERRLYERPAWDAERALRRAMEELAETVWAAGSGDLCRGAYAASLEIAAAELLRRGV